MESSLITRRQFGKSVLRLLFFGGAGLTAFKAEKGGYDPVSTFISLGLDFGSPHSVAAKFVRSDTAFLMASYAVFFPEFLRLHGFDSVKALQIAAPEQKKSYSKDHHRLDALPSVAAAHLMPCAKKEATRHQLSRSILTGLKDSRREVREIVLQNLVTSVAPNFDSARYFSLEPTVIKQLMMILEEACSNQKLITPALLCIEFLLNARSLLKSRKARIREIRPYTEAIKLAQELKVPHMCYVPQLIRLHEATFKASPNNINSLPPQSSEALMGWRNLYRNREYLTLLAMSRARLVYTNYLTVSGKLPADAAMSIEEAKRALPKTISFFNAFELRNLFKGSSIPNAISKHEPEFGKFLRQDFRELLKYPSKFGVSLDGFNIDEKMVKLGNYVPFAQFEDRSLLCRSLHERNERKRRAIINGLLVGFGAAISIDSVVALAKWVSGLNTPPSAETIEKTRAEIEMREKAIENGNYKGLDQQQEDLGDIDLNEISTEDTGD